MIIDITSIDQADLAVAIADKFLCQPKEMPWEDRTSELAEAVIQHLTACAMLEDRDRQSLRLGDRAHRS